MRFVAILGQLCKIAKSHNIRSPVWKLSDEFTVTTFRARLLHIRLCCEENKIDKGELGIMFFQ